MRRSFLRSFAAALLALAPPALAQQLPTTLVPLEGRSRIAKVIVFVPPDYPYELLRERVSGQVDLHGVVDASGRLEVQRMEAKPDREELRQAIREVMSKWLLRPAYDEKDCSVRPVEVQLTLWFEKPEKGRGVISISGPSQGELAAQPQRQRARELQPERRLEPAYPRYAINEGMQTRLEAYFRVAATGEVEDVIIGPGLYRSVFAPSLRETLMQWRFPGRPGEGGACVMYEVVFRLR